MTDVVVKVGGSLFDHPRLGPGLRASLLPLSASGRGLGGGVAFKPRAENNPTPQPPPRSGEGEQYQIVLVAGGGPFADAVRGLDAVHALGVAAAHRVALESLRASAALLRHLTGGAGVLDVPDFLAEFERAHGPVPESWDVTTDSLAGYAAGHLGRRLVLLKSADLPPGLTWEAAAAAGLVDAHFPAVVRRFGLRVEWLNFRRLLDGTGGAAGRPLG